MAINQKRSTTQKNQQLGRVSLLSMASTILSALAVVYLLFWPTSIKPAAWRPPKDAGYVGAFAPNQRLAGLHLVKLADQQVGPEHIAAHAGAVYTGLINGDIVKVSAEDLRLAVVLNTGGRPLGIDFDAQGRMLVADAFLGLLRVTGEGTQAHVETILTRLHAPSPEDSDVDVNSVKAAPDGTIWVTEASHRFGAKSLHDTFKGSMFDTLEHSCSGRLMRVNPATLDTQVALVGLCFSNGIALSADGKSLFLAETENFRILKINLEKLALLRAPTYREAVAAGAVSTLIDNLPGFPDNLMRGDAGRIWVGLTKPRSELSDRFAEYPEMRTVMARLPTMFWPVPKPYGHVFAFDEQGKVMDDLQDPSGAYPDTTSATEINGKLFVQSLHAHNVGWMPYPGPGHQGQ